MKLIIFDCDDTIWKIPYKENDYYMDLPESITKHNFEYNTDILNIYNSNKDKNTKFVILTNRTILIKNVLLSKLKDEQNLVFDYELFRNNDRNKAHRLEKLLSLLRNEVKEVEFYDDKQKHINSIEKIKKIYPTIKIKTHKV